jgi:hypothetical protein
LFLLAGFNRRDIRSYALGVWLTHKFPQVGAPSLRVLCARVGVYEPRPSVFLVPTGPAPQLPLLEPGKTQPSPSVRCMELAYPGAQ